MKVYDFVDGKISDNILHALDTCDAATIVKLTSSGALEQFASPSRKFPSYKYPALRNLRYCGLDDYAEASGYGIRYFLYGEGKPFLPFCSEMDEEVIAALNTLSEEQLEHLKQVTLLFYSNPLMTNKEWKTPSQRFLAVLRTRHGSGLPDAVPEKELWKYTSDVMQEIERYKASRYSPLFLFNSECWPDLSTLTGISVRWLLGVKKHALYTEHPVADDIFDMYTLMQPKDRQSFIGLLWQFSGADEDSAMYAYFTQRNGV